MDPEVLYDQWYEGGLAEGPRREIAKALIDWLLGGGFEPTWNKSRRAEFISWSVHMKVLGARTLAAQVGRAK